MVQIDINKWIVYNNDGLLVLMEAWYNSNNTADFHIKAYLNRQNHSDNYIIANLKKTISFIDKFRSALKKEALYSPLNRELSLGDEILESATKDNNDLHKKFNEITNMIKSVPSQGKIVADFDVMNGFIITDCALEEMTGFFNGFESLQSKHDNKPSKKGR